MSCHGLLSSFSGTISLNSSRWESCVGPSWFARSNPNASNRIITSHPMPLPHISRLLELRKVNLPWLLVQNQTQHVTFLLPWLMPTSKTYWSSDPHPSTTMSNVLLVRSFIDALALCYVCWLISLVRLGPMMVHRCHRVLIAWYVAPKSCQRIWWRVTWIVKLSGA